MNLEDLLKFDFAPEAALPIFMLSPNQLVLPAKMDKVTVTMFRRYSFVDENSRVWQGYFITNQVSGDTKPLNGSESGKELLFVFFCQGGVNEVQTLIDPPIFFKEPYHIMVTRENYTLRNTGIYAIPFDYEVDRKSLYDMGDALVDYLRGLTTGGIIQQVEKWINATLPLIKYHNLRHNRVKIHKQDYTTNFNAHYIPPQYFQLIELPVDAGGINRMVGAIDRYEWYKPEEVAPIQQRKILDRMFSIMGTAVPIEQSIPRPFGCHVRGAYGSIPRPEEKNRKPDRYVSFHIAPN